MTLAPPTSAGSTGQLSPRSKPLPSPGRAQSASSVTASVSAPASTKGEQEERRQALLRRVEDFKKKKAQKDAAATSKDALLDSSSSSSSSSDREEEVVSPGGIAKTSPRPRLAAAGVGANRKAKVGDEVEARYKEDGLFYAARVEKTFVDGSVMVLFTEYGNQQRCLPADLRPRNVAAAVVPVPVAVTTSVAAPAKRAVPRATAVTPPKLRLNAEAASPRAAAELDQLSSSSSPEQEERSPKPRAARPAEPPSLMTKILTFFGDDDSVESPSPVVKSELSASKQDFFDNLFESTNSLSLSSSGFFEPMKK
jgi:hypothetical protein